MPPAILFCKWPGAGAVVLKKPVVYQESATGKSAVAGRFFLHSNKEIGFTLGKYDPGRTLVIDPVLVYSTLLGGSGDDQGHSVAVDTSGNIYVFGRTGSVNFPKAPGAAPGSAHCFVVKINPAGTDLIYSTYLGGDSVAFCGAILVDSAGNAFIAGNTTSPNFPTRRPLQGFKGMVDLFVSELNAAGSDLIFSTYLGGSNVNFYGGLARDSAGDLYVTGSTNSTDFPVQSGFSSNLAGRLAKRLCHEIER